MRNNKGQFVKCHQFTDEMLTKMSNAKIGKATWNNGRKANEETRLKQSIAKIGCTPWNKGSDIKQCQVCNTSFHVAPYEIKKGRKFCSSNCYHKSTNKTPEEKRIRNSIEHKLWRDAVFARDNWTCQKYNIQGGVIRAHHILNFAQHPELRLAIDNGITLSEQAHKEFHKKYGNKNNTKEQLEEFLKPSNINFDLN